MKNRKTPKKVKQLAVPNYRFSVTCENCFYKSDTYITNLLDNERGCRHPDHVGVVSLGFVCDDFKFVEELKKFQKT
jgi:hypothetical protein